MKGLVSLGGEEFSEFQKEKTASELQVLFNQIKISLGKYSFTNAESRRSHVARIKGSEYLNLIDQVSEYGS